MIAIDTVVRRLAGHRPRRLPGRQWVTRCGVVVLVADHGPDARAIPPSVLMMRRAEREGDPWSGDIAFPGGRVSVDDASTRAAALRELREETGFNPLGRRTGIEAVGRLSDLLTKEHGRMRPMVVSPYIYRTHRAVVLRPGAEAAQLLWVPLEHFCDARRRTTRMWKVGGLSINAPAVQLDGALVWGLSLMMIDELLRAGGLRVS